MSICYTHLVSAIRPCILTLLLTCLLAACGGGGSGGNTNTTTGSTNNPATPTDDEIEIINIFSDRASYYDPVELLQMDVPDGWETFQITNSPEILITMADLDTATLQTGFIFVLKVGAFNEVDVSDDGDINTISQQNVILNGLAALEEIGDIILDNDDYRVISTALEFNDNIYAIVYANLVDNFNNFLVDYYAAIASFKIGEKLLTDLENFSDYRNPGQAGLASDGNNFLFVSCRNSTVNPGLYDLVGRLIREDRTVEAEFVIHPDLKYNGDSGGAKCVHASPGAIFDGVNYLVTYITDKPLTSTTTVQGKRISTAGTLLDATPVDISQSVTGDAYQASAVFDGTNTFVVWYEERFAGPGKFIKGAFIEPDNDVTIPVVISNDLDTDYPNTSFEMFIPQVAYGNSRFLVIWGPYLERRYPLTSDDYTIYGQLVGLDGILQLPLRFPIRTDTGGTPRYPQAASNGNEFLVGWIEGAFIDSSAENGTYEIYSRRISVAGNLVNGTEDDPGTLIAPVFVPSITEAPKDFLNLTYEDNNYLFLWSTVNPIAQKGVYGVSASNNLGSITSPQRVVGALTSVTYNNPAEPREPGYPAVAYSDDAAMIVWPSWYDWVESWYFEGGIID